MRWSLVGNAVTTPVAAWFGARLNDPGRYEPDRNMAIDAQKRWPKAARFDGERRHGVRIGAFPVWRERPSLAAFLAYPGKPLSVRATRGFLSRTHRGTLRFVPGFRDRLRDHLSAMETTGDHRALFAAE
jgi:DNA (cytosine-5)-methyltransferase 1